MNREELEAALQGYVGKEIGAPWVASDPVNQAMVRHFCAAVGDTNPAYLDAAAAEKSVHGGVVAPPTMMDAWTMPGMGAAWVQSEGEAQDLQVEMHRLLSEHGYTGVVATNQEQEYDRYLREGDRLTARIVFDSVSEQKATPLGIGYFITTKYTFLDQNDEQVGTMSFRVLKYKPAQAPQPASEDGATTAAAQPKRIRPPMGHDNAWWWEAINVGELRIQRCKKCSTLRHPPRPMCGECRSVEWDSVAASGKGTLHSHTVLHHPKFPGFDYPVICALVDLEEGTRIVSNVVGCAAEDIEIGMSLCVSIEQVDDEMKLPLFRPA